MFSIKYDPHQSPERDTVNLNQEQTKHMDGHNEFLTPCTFWASICKIWVKLCEVIMTVEKTQETLCSEQSATRDLTGISFT